MDIGSREVLIIYVSTRDSTDYYLRLPFYEAKLGTLRENDKV